MKKSLLFRRRVTVAFFDFLFILILLILLFAFFAFARPRAAGKEEALLYRVRFPLLREEYVSDIHIGDCVLDAVGKRSIGQVTDFEISPAMTEVYSRRSGRMRRVPYPHRVTLILTVEAHGVREENGWSVAGLTLMRGEELPLRLPNFVGNGSIIFCSGAEQ